MGSICCCLLGNQEEGHSNVSGFNSFFNNVMNRFGSILDEGDEGMVAANPRQGSSIRPSSTDPGPGIPSSQHSGQLDSSVPERRAANPLQPNREPSKKSKGDKGKQLKTKERSRRCIVNLQECQSESSASKIESRSAPCVDSAADDDEDVCPTCLEEYTPENPKIVAKCNHEFHLACIFEWMKRSECCPVCGKLMMFEETE